MRKVNQVHRNGEVVNRGKAGASKVSPTAKGRKSVGRKVKPKAAKGAGANAPAVRTKVEIEKPVLVFRELDPVRVCGERTTVVRLFRVDETISRSAAEKRGSRSLLAGGRQSHLVFNDRHGWYCEHGRSCHAVTAVMRHARVR